MDINLFEKLNDINFPIMGKQKEFTITINTCVRYIYNYSSDIKLKLVINNSVHDSKIIQLIDNNIINYCDVDNYKVKLKLSSVKSRKIISLSVNINDDETSITKYNEFMIKYDKSTYRVYNALPLPNLNLNEYNESDYNINISDDKPIKLISFKNCYIQKYVMISHDSHKIASFRFRMTVNDVLNKHNMIYCDKTINERLFYIHEIQTNYLHFIKDNVPHILCYIELKKQIKDLKLYLNSSKILSFVTDMIQSLNINMDDVISIKDKVITNHNIDETIILDCNKVMIETSSVFPYLHIGLQNLLESSKQLLYDNINNIPTYDYIYIYQDEHGYVIIRVI